MPRVIDHSTRLICRKPQVGEVIDSKWSMNQLKLSQVLYCIQRGKNSPTGKSALLIIIRNDTIFIYFNCLISKENTRSMNGVIHTSFRFLTRVIFLVHLPKGKMSDWFFNNFFIYMYFGFLFEVWYKVIDNLLFYIMEHVSTFHTTCISHDFRFQV